MKHVACFLPHLSQKPRKKEKKDKGKSSKKSTKKSASAEPWKVDEVYGADAAVDAAFGHPEMAPILQDMFNFPPEDLPPPDEEEDTDAFEFNEGEQLTLDETPQHPTSQVDLFSVSHKSFLRFQ